MTDTETVGNHVLLAELALHPVRPNAVPQGAEEPCIVGRELSAGTHTLSWYQDEQKHHEQTCVFSRLQRGSKGLQGARSA
jgi:hypothetical protein